MISEKECPEYLYRGMCIRYEDLKEFAFAGVDMELPYKPDFDEQGRETVHDGNEYGIYMSDNPKVSDNAYGNATNRGDGTYIEPRISIGNRGGNYIKIPEVGICYKISTKNLDIRKPWISTELQGVYNNGFKGDEWITDKIPAENYEIMSVQIGGDILHDEQYIEIDDIEHIKENTIKILEQRKERLETFAQEMSKLPDQKRREFTLTHLEVCKDIYGENGFKYMNNIEEIDTSSNAGRLKYLMANVYKQDTENIDFDTLAHLQDIKERAEIADKKGKEFDLNKYLSNDLLEKMKELIQQKENDKAKLNFELETEPLVDYYEKYGISPDDNWKVAKQKLNNESRKWMKRQSSTDSKEALEEINSELDCIDSALKIFNPQNTEMRKTYDAMLEEQKENANHENTLSIHNIAETLKRNPVSLAQLKDTQREMSNMIKNRGKAKTEVNLQEDRNTL